ncbi:MAG: hypothetical protein RLZ98_2780 [Pseudomonadota bacterium]|jgi:polysaccharide pyruvyl transferase WcaK-like protein
MNVVVFNVKYSPNLGDGVIAECLEAELRNRTGWSVTSIDLAGRTEWKTPGRSRLRILALDLLTHLPTTVRDAIVATILGRKLHRSLIPLWKQALARANVAVFGGGQLIQDGDLNFPLKLQAAAHECAAYALPMAVYAVGASPSRSPRGRRCFSEILSSERLFLAGARDARSISILKSLGAQPRLTLDPGLLASRTWPSSRKEVRTRQRAGLCITHPAVISHHATGGRGVSAGEALDLYEKLAGNLAAQGFDVLCFTNGAGEDEAALDELRGRMAAGNDNIMFAQRAETPRALAQTIADCDVVVAHRLHATIIAYSYNVPAIGLMWDEKVDAFFELVKRDRHMLPFDQATADGIAESARSAIEEGIAAATHAEILAQASAGIDELATEIAKATARIPAIAATPRDRGEQSGGRSRHANAAAQPEAAGARQQW